jgi:hypothetical protein
MPQIKTTFNLVLVACKESTAANPDAISEDTCSLLCSRFRILALPLPPAFKFCFLSTF